MATELKHGRIKLFLGVALILAALALGLFWQRMYTFAERPLVLPDEQQRVLLVEPGDGFNTVLAKIRTLGVVQGNDLEWKALAMRLRVADRLQVGEYGVETGMSPRKLLLRLGKGEVIQRKFTIVEGWNVRELRAALAANQQLVHEIDKLSDAEIMERLGRKDIHPEGRFLPETYVFTRGTGELAILERAARAMDDLLEQTWASRAEGLPLDSPDELLTLASIVEKETGLGSERPLIAGVFSRRLKLGMRLETDPTVIYGMGSSYAGNIRKTDLQTNTPYNTYVHAGLPPTPIAMPGKAALEATAHPADGDELYFVASGNGGHYFSSSYAEHTAAVRKYQLKR